MDNYFKTVYDQYHKKVFLFVNHYIEGKDDAEDVVQEVFVHLWKHIKKLRSAGSPEPIIFKTSKQEIANYYRRKKIKFDFLDEDMHTVDNAYDAQSDIQDKHRLDKINLLIDTLPDRRRTIFMENVVEEMSYAQIATRHNISKSAVAKQITKVLQFLRANF